MEEVQGNSVHLWEKVQAYIQVCVYQISNDMPSAKFCHEYHLLPSSRKLY